MKYLYISVICLALFGAGCFANRPTSLVPRPTSTEQDVTATVDQAQTVPGTDDWLQYRNYNYGFDFKYPASAVEVFRSDSANGTVLTLDLGPTVASSTAVSVPNDTLNVKIISKDGSGLERGANLIDGCYDERDGSVETTPGVVYNGQQVCVAEGSGAAAGNRYNAYWYTIPLTDKYVVLAYTVHSVICENFETPGACIAFNESRDSLVSKMMMATLNTFTPNASKQESNLRFETVAVKEDTKSYSIDVQYPVMFGGDEKVRGMVNNSIRDFALISVAEFRKIVKETVSSPGPLVLQADYSIHYVKSGIVSVVFDGYEYTGGAHGISTFETFIFDLSDGQQLSLDEIFKPDSNFLKIISDYASAELSKQADADADWIKTGASPDPKNYRYYYLTQDGLAVIFPEYQVAPYAAGSNIVTVPYQVLKSILKLEL